MARVLTIAMSIHAKNNAAQIIANTAEPTLKPLPKPTNV